MAERPGHAPLPQVAIHHDDGLVGISDAGCNIAHHKGFSRSRIERSQCYDISLGCRVLHEFDIGGKDAQRLCQDGLGHAVVVDDPFRSLGLPALHPFHPAMLDKRDLTEERNGNGLFDLFPRTHSGVKEQPAYQDDERNGQTYQDTQEDGLGLARGYMSVLRFRRVDDLGVVVSHRLGEGIFLAAVQQEHVQSFLDVLLALDAEHLPGG